MIVGFTDGLLERTKKLFTHATRADLYKKQRVIHPSTNVASSNFFSPGSYPLMGSDPQAVCMCVFVSFHV